MKKLLFIKLFLVLIMFAIGIYFYPRLPEQMPIHWNYAGVADNYSSKGKAVFLFPGIALFLVILFYFLPKLDPKKDNYPKFEKVWEAFQFALLIFFLYTYILTIYFTLNDSKNIGQYMMLGIGLLFIVLGNYMGKIRRNYFIGIRLPWTIENEDVWNKTHRLGGKTFMLAGAVFILNSYFNFKPEIVLGLVIGLILIVPVIYSYLEYRKISVKK